MISTSVIFLNLYSRQVSLYMKEQNYLHANYIGLFIAEKELKTAATQLSYKEALITGMKESVDEFYSEMSVKISSMKKEQKREIRDIMGKMKTGTSASAYSVNSNLTISSWTSEKQHEIHKQLSQLVSESRSQLE